MRHVPRHAFPPSHPHGFPQCYLLFLLELRFRGAGQVQEYQDFMKLFKPEILDKQMRVALEMKCVSLPLLTSESWQVLSHSRLQMKPANVTPKCSTCPPFLPLPNQDHAHVSRKMAASSLQLTGCILSMYESTSLSKSKSILFIYSGK